MHEQWIDIAEFWEWLWVKVNWSNTLNQMVCGIQSKLSISQWHLINVPVPDWQIFHLSPLLLAVSPLCPGSSVDILGGHLACVLENTNESNITETIVELLDKNIQWQAFHHLYRLNEMKGILYSVFVTPFCSLSFSFRYHWKGENNTNVTNLSNSNTDLDNSSKK